MDIVGVIGAVPEEVLLLVDALGACEKETCAGIDYYTAVRGGRRVVVCSGGMGKANAASTVQVLVSRFGAQAIIFSGVAGNLSSRVHMGEIVIGSEIVYHDADSELLAQSPPFKTVFTSNPLLARAAEQACKGVGVCSILGRIATGDRFVGDEDTKRRICESYSPDCVEMEGAAVAQTAGRNGVPFVVLRAMSDDAARPYAEVEQDIFDIGRYVQTASRIVLAMLDNMPPVSALQ